MSRAGRASGAAAKRREVQERMAAAIVDREQPDGPEMPPEVLAQFKAQQLFIRCKAVIVERYPSLWPGESIGAAIAEQWMQTLMLRIQEQAAADTRARAEAAGLVLPG